MVFEDLTIDGKPIAGEPADYTPYGLVDAKLTWDVSRKQGSGIRFYLSGENLLDKAYVDHGNVPQPGRWLKAGVQIRLSQGR